MLLKLGEWEFEINMEATMAYSAQEAADHCDCAYCRNFYACVDTQYPQLRPFLAQFGVDIEAPEELFPYDVEDQMYYDGIYSVSGRIIKPGSHALQCGDISIAPTANEYIEQGLTLDVSTVILPWVLDEPMKETVSPANLPDFLKKMWDRLLGKVKKSDIHS